MHFDVDTGELVYGAGTDKMRELIKYFTGSTPRADGCGVHQQPRAGERDPVRRPTACISFFYLYVDSPTKVVWISYISMRDEEKEARIG